MENLNEIGYDRRSQAFGGSPGKQGYTSNKEQFADYEGDNLAPQFRNFNFGSVSEDETQVNNILKGLRAKLSDLENNVNQKENEKAGIIEDINVLTQRLGSLTKSIEKKRLLYENYDKILKDSESAFAKITESTKTLLAVVKREQNSLSKVTLAKKVLP